MTPFFDALPPTGEHREIIGRAVEALQRGEIIAIPTDTVYGLAARFDDADAIRQLFEFKVRPTNKAIPVLLSDMNDVCIVAPVLPEAAHALAAAFWPGALTMVVLAREGLCAGITSIQEDGAGTVAVRVPDHTLARSIISGAGGALAVTSANRSGEAPATRASDLGGLDCQRLALIVDGGEVKGGVASTIVDVTGPDIVVLREGSISKEMLERALASCSMASGSMRVVAV